MKYCKKCKVFVAGSRSECPLCQNPISGTENGNSEDKFPKIPHKKSKLKFVWKLFILITISILIISVIVNYETPHKSFWSRFVVVGVITSWVCVYIALKKYRNILKCLLYETIAVAGFILFWDYYTGGIGWSINFVIPIIFSLVIFTMGLLSKVLKIDAEEHIVYLVSLVLFGMIPGALLWMGKVKIELPSMICSGISTIAFFSVLLFEGKKMWIEFTKRLHM